MNKTRAKKIAKISDKIEALRCQLEEILGDEQDYFDNLSEKQQEGEKGEESENAISYLGDAMSNLEDARDILGNIEVE